MPGMVAWASRRTSTNWTPSEDVGDVGDNAFRVCNRHAWDGCMGFAKNIDELDAERGCRRRWRQRISCLCEFYVLKDGETTCLP
uniref:Uncharacterized protein n=1 Tax=Caenorhabditis japonica TaxID=281687 RepID=A0A8R1HMN4_CAEJA